jgi:hypothetical protein
LEVLNGELSRFDPLTGIVREKNIQLSKRGGKQLLGLGGTGISGLMRQWFDPIEPRRSP